MTTIHDKPAMPRADGGTGRGAAALRRTAAWCATVLVVLLPLAVAVAGHGKAAVPALLFLIGLGALFSPGVRGCFRATWPVFASVLLAVAVAAANVLVHGLGWRPMDQPAHILLFGVIAAVFALGLRLRMMWLGLALTPAVLGGVCIWQHHVLGVARPYGLNGGTSAAIELAILLLALALVALTRMLREGASLPARLVFGACAVLGAYGALLTQSRGPLLAAVPAFAVVVLIYARRSHHWRRGALVIGVCVLGAALLAVAMRHTLAPRFDAARQELTALQQHRDTNGSLGKRLEMWVVAWRAFRTHPVLGVGLDQYHTFAHGEIAAGRAWPSIGPYNQPHNAYLNAAACGGVFSLGALLLLLLTPLRYFLRHLRDADSEVAATAIAGTAVVVLYAVSCLGEGVFYRIMSLSLYFFLALGFVILIESRVRSRTAPPAGA